MNNLINEIKDLASNGSTKTKIEGYLMYAHDMSKAEAAKAVKEAGVAGGRVDFRAGFYEWLLEGVKTEEEVYAYIKKEGSGNTMKHKTHYWAIARDLANLIHKG